MMRSTDTTSLPSAIGCTPTRHTLQAGSAKRAQDEHTSRVGIDFDVTKAASPSICLASCILLCRLPEDFLEEHNYYMDTRRLRIATSNMMNSNHRADLAKVRDAILKNLAALPPPGGAPLAAQPAAGKPADAPEEDPDARGGGACAPSLLSC